MPRYRLRYGTYHDAESGARFEAGDVFVLDEEQAAFLGNQVEHIGPTRAEADATDDEPGSFQIDGETDDTGTTVADVLGDEQTLADLETALETGNWDTHEALDALVAYEEDHQDRAGAYRLIKGRRDSVEDSRNLTNEAE